MRVSLPNGVRRGAAWTFYSYVGSLLCQAAYFFLVARSLGPREFGVFATSLAVFTMLGPFVLMGSGNLLVRTASRGSRSLRPDVRRSLALVALNASLICSIAVAISWTVFPTNILVVLVLAVSELFFARLSEFSGQYFQAVDRLSVTANLNMVAPVLRLILAGAFSSTSLGTSEWWAVFYGGASLIAGITAVGAMLVDLSRSVSGGASTPSNPSPRWLSHYRDGFPFVVGQVSKTVYMDSDKVVVAQFLGASIAGNYSVAARIVSIAAIPSQAIIYSLNREFFQRGDAETDSRESLADLLRAIAPTIFAIGVLGAGALIALSFAIPSVLGTGYAESAEMVRWLALLPLIQAGYYSAGDALMGLDRQGLRSALQLTCATLNVVLNLATVPIWGWHAAVVATYASESLLLVCLLVVLVRHIRRSATVPNRPTEALHG